MITPRKTIIVPTAPAGKKENPFETGVLLNFNQERRGGLAIELLLVMDKKEGRSIQRIPLSGHHYKTYLQGLPAAVGAILGQLTDDALVGALVSGGYAWLQDADKPFDLLDERHYTVLREWVGGVLEELKPLAPAIKRLYYLPAGEAFFSGSIRSAAISTATPYLQFRLERVGGRLALRCSVAINNGVFPLADFQQPAYFLKSGNEFFILKKEDRAVLHRLEEGDFQVREEGMPRFMAMVVGPLAERYPVDLSAVIRTEIVDEWPQGRVHVSELNENFLLIKPGWMYSDLEVEAGEEAETRVEREDRILMIQRKKEEEGKLMAALVALNPKFESQRNGYYYLSFKEALHKSWFLQFYHRMQELDIPVLGMNKLRKFKYNTHTPTFEITAGRGIDWFDLTIRVSYGEQVVPLSELRKAILGKQEYILLADGSLGILPKEWVEKYTLLLKIGALVEGSLRLPALHWSVLEESGGAAGDEALQKELEEKRRRWQQVDRDKVWRVPATVMAELRDYQQGGFQWLCLLDEMGWGGVLADDMGLGKTLQTLSFLQHIVQRYPEETHLVICPTSLLYNWEAEIKKFVPGLEYRLHYGAERKLDEERFNLARVIITSYGMVRSDIGDLSRLKFGYVILDESQAIKNPASQTRKAVQQLKARNRLALSGTPVQNSTFDLYAQMDFLNPGMLGSQDFFRNEFATAIDRNGDKEAAARLRKLVYPFILRRTKEQVARDLPDKTEMILWCEMGEQQRKIYDQFKETYRSALLGRIFLISLKAGGVGLTLTAADYVYLVDPWWNPAAEQQAIDRTHRIGQDKKVFAYRMICRDTVEEKILQLQDRKRSLAADLIADEAGFVKQLTEEDVAYLFS